MYQVYLLSVVTLILGSVSLGFPELNERLRVGSLFREETFTSAGFRFGLGVVTFLVGFFRFLTIDPVDTIIIGNIVPAAAGMIIGAALVLAYYREKSTVESPLSDRLDGLLLKNAAPISYLGLLIAAIHFFFHAVLFL